MYIKLRVSQFYGRIKNDGVQEEGADNIYA